MATPAGWYPDPDHAGPPPPGERWWDGRTWTAHTRPPGGAAPAQQYVQAPAPYGAAPGTYGTDPYVSGTAPYGYGFPPGPAPRRSRPLRAVALVTALVLALVVAGVAYTAVTGDDGGRDDESAAAGLTAAQAGGVALPLFDGWTEAATEVGVMVTTDPYPCPGDEAQQCVGGAASLGVLPQATDTPEDLARADIEDHAQGGYGSDDLYGGVTDTEEIAAEQVTVLGEDGYRVRARVTTGIGMEAVIETVAFPAPDGSGLALLRIAFDERDSAPPVSEMERILSGLRTAGTGPGTEV